MTQIPTHIANRAKPIWAGEDDLTGEPYLPSNGSEGDIFMSHWCRQCTQDRNEDCEILTLSFVGEQPDEWVYCGHAPVCTAWVQK